jgi:hypothetical protein
MSTNWECHILDYFFENGDFKGKLEDLAIDIFNKYVNSLSSRDKHFSFNNRREVGNEIINSINNLSKLLIINEEEGIFKTKKEILDKIGQIKSEIYYERLKEINSD